MKTCFADTVDTVLPDDVYVCIDYLSFLPKSEK